MTQIQRAVERRGKGIVRVEPLPDRFKVTNQDIEDLTFEVEQTSHFTTSDGRLIHTQRSYKSHRK